MPSFSLPRPLVTSAPLLYSGGKKGEGKNTPGAPTTNNLNSKLAGRGREVFAEQNEITQHVWKKSSNILWGRKKKQLKRITPEHTTCTSHKEKKTREKDVKPKKQLRAYCSNIQKWGRARTPRIMECNGSLCFRPNNTRTL